MLLLLGMIMGSLAECQEEGMGKGELGCWALPAGSGQGEMRQKIKIRIKIKIRNRIKNKSKIKRPDIWLDDTVFK